MLLPVVTDLVAYREIWDLPLACGIYLFTEFVLGYLAVSFSCLQLWPFLAESSGACPTCWGWGEASPPGSILVEASLLPLWMSGKESAPRPKLELCQLHSLTHGQPALRCLSPRPRGDSSTTLWGRRGHVPSSGVRESVILLNTSMPLPSLDPPRVELRRCCRPRVSCSVGRWPIRRAVRPGQPQPDDARLADWGRCPRHRCGAVSPC